MCKVWMIKDMKTRKKLLASVDKGIYNICLQEKIDWKMVKKQFRWKLYHMKGFQCKKTRDKHKDILCINLISNGLLGYEFEYAHFSKLLTYAGWFFFLSCSV